MKEHLTGDVLYGDMRLSRDVFKGSFVIFEGSSDALLYERFLDNRNCEIVIGHNKENVIDAINHVNENGFNGVVGIVDADFWIHEEKPPPIKNIFWTDFHDLEVLILKSPALDKVLKELGSEDKIKDYEKKHGKQIRQVLFEIGKHIGLFRYISNKNEYFLSFQDLCLGDYLDIENFTVDTASMVEAIKNKSQKHVLKSASILESLRAQIAKGCTPEQVSCGHDLVEILSIGLRKHWGSRKAIETAPEFLEKILRIAYEFNYFSDTRLYSSIMDWENKNSPFKIFLQKS